MLHCIMPASLQNIYKTINIALYIDMGICYGISYASLSAKINYCIKTAIGKKHLHSLFVFKIHPYEGKSSQCVTLREFIPCYRIF